MIFNIFNILNVLNVWWMMCEMIIDWIWVDCRDCVGCLVGTNLNPSFWLLSVVILSFSITCFCNEDSLLRLVLSCLQVDWIDLLAFGSLPRTHFHIRTMWKEHLSHYHFKLLEEDQPIKRFPNDSQCFP